jgi:hypothetical protein
MDVTRSPATADEDVAGLSRDGSEVARQLLRAASVQRLQARHYEDLARVAGTPRTARTLRRMADRVRSVSGTMRRLARDMPGGAYEDRVIACGRLQGVTGSVLDEDPVMPGSRRFRPGLDSNTGASPPDEEA